MKEFEIIPYNKKDGSSPVLEFISSLNPKMKAKVLMEVDLLEEYGNELGGKYTKHLDDGIFELRVKVSSDITRILYFFCIGKKIILTNGFIKKHKKRLKKKLI